MENKDANYACKGWEQRNRLVPQAQQAAQKRGVWRFARGDYGESPRAGTIGFLGVIAPKPASAASRNVFFTMRSSMLWKEITAEPSAGRERVDGRRKPFSQSAYLIVDRDAKRLKCPRRRMNFLFVIPRRRTCLDCGNERSGRENAFRRTRFDNRARDRARETLLAIHEDDVGKRRLARTVDDIGGGLAVPVSP